MSISKTADPVASRSLNRRDAMVLTGISGGHAVSHLLLQSFLVMLPAVRDALGIGPIQVGAISTAREIASGLVSVPGGLIFDRFRYHWGRVLAICMAGFALGWFVVAAAPSYLVLVLGMVIMSVAASLWHLPAMAALSARFAHIRGTALSIHGIGGNVGDIIGPAMTGFLLGFMSWRGVLSIYAVVPLLLAVAVLWVMRDWRQTQEAAHVALNMRTQLQATAGLLKNVTLWRINLVSALRGMCYQVYTTFLPLYLADELGLDAKGIGLYIALLFSVSIVASPAMGYLSDRLNRKVILVPMLMGSCLFAVLLALYGRGISLAILLALLGLFLRSDYSLLSAAALDIVGGSVATTTLGVLSFTRFALGAISPLVAGLLYQRHGMGAAFYFVAILFGLAALILATTSLEPSTSQEAASAS